MFSGFSNLSPQTRSYASSQGGAPRDDVLSVVLTSLVVASLSPSTKALYKRTLIEFAHSFQAVNTERFLATPASITQVLRYITVQFQQGLSCASIRSHLSAISFWHKLHGWCNPVDSFIVCKCLIGVSNSLPPHDPHKLSVMPNLLRQISLILPAIFSDPYQVIMFRAVFLLAFFAFLRVSEYVSS